MPNPPCVLRLIVNICVLCFALAACTGDEPKPNEVLHADKMAAILTDVHLIEGAKTGRKIMGDTLTIETYYAKIFSKHNTNLKDFNTSFEYYSRHPKIMNTIYEQVVENLNKMEIRVPAWDKRGDSTSVPLDSNTVNAFKEIQKKALKSMPFGRDTSEVVDSGTSR